MWSSVFRFHNNFIRCSVSFSVFYCTFTTFFQFRTKLLFFSFLVSHHYNRFPPLLMLYDVIMRSPSFYVYFHEISIGSPWFQLPIAPCFAVTIMFITHSLDDYCSPYINDKQQIYGSRAALVSGRLV